MQGSENTALSASWRWDQWGWEQGSSGYGTVGQWATNANQRDQAWINMYAKVKVAGFSHYQLAHEGCIVLFVIIWNQPSKVRLGLK
jgi:hypothetical protein